jgi:glycosyltransferase involved in cell wall biosynthesis
VCFRWPVLAAGPFAPEAAARACTAAVAPAASAAGLSERACVHMDGYRPPASPLSPVCDPAPCLLLEAVDRAAVAAATPIASSVIMTVYRSADFVRGTLAAAVQHATGLWELIVVVDGNDGATVTAVLAEMTALVQDRCRWARISDADIQDTTPSACPSAAAATPSTATAPPTGTATSTLALVGMAGLVHVRALLMPTPVFETQANNVGMRAAAGRVVVLLQDDMYMETLGYNELLAVPLLQWEDVVGTSGRCTHMLFSKAASDARQPYPDSVGRCAGDFGAPLTMPAAERRVFYARDTIKRGPLAYRTDRIRQLGYLDEAHFYLGWDDHDVSCRAFLDHQWLVGFVPMDVRAPIELGATRRLFGERPKAEVICLAQRRQRAGHRDQAPNPRCYERGPSVVHHSVNRAMCMGDTLPAGCRWLPDP